MTAPQTKDDLVRTYTRCQIATAIAILFHLVGLTGLLFFDRNLFLSATPGNLLLMGVLLFWTQSERNGGFFFFMFACLAVGIIVEIVGVRSALLFGDYSYGVMMGLRLMDTPLIVGVNWFMVIYCSASAVFLLRWRGIAASWVIVAGAGLATGYDWIMEPVASDLGYWRWAGDGRIPPYNYLCWFLVSALLLAIFQFVKFQKPNRFAANLMVIQILFFLILRIAVK